MNLEDPSLFVEVLCAHLNEQGAKGLVKYLTTECFSQVAAWIQGMGASSVDCLSFRVSEPIGYMHCRLTQNEHCSSYASVSCTSSADMLPHNTTRPSLTAYLTVCRRWSSRAGAPSLSS